MTVSKEASATAVAMDGEALREVKLMEGETLDSALNVAEGSDGAPADGPGVVLLTDMRVIQFISTGRRKDTTFMALQNVETVEITRRRQGFGAYLWSGLALLVALLVWQAWSEATWSLPAALAVAFMGVYLAVDRLLSSGPAQATFRAGLSEMQCPITDGLTTEQVNQFVNRLFELKAERDRQAFRHSRPFAPR